MKAKVAYAVLLCLMGYGAGAMASGEKRGLPPIIIPLYLIALLLWLISFNAVAGQPSEDFQSSLPEGLSASDVRKLIAPNEEMSRAIYFEAKPWTDHTNNYVVIACFSDTQDHHDGHMSFIRSGNGQVLVAKRPKCDGLHSPDIRAYLGILKYKQNETSPTLVASYGKPLDLTTSWKTSNLAKAARAEPYAEIPSPAFPANFYDLPETNSINIRESESVIGLRFGWEGWCINPNATTSTTFGVLALFRIENSQLINIFSEPIDVSKGYYSEHLVAKNNLVVRQQKTNGYFELQTTSSLDSGWHRTFVWNNDKNKFTPTETECNEESKVQQASRTYSFDICYSSEFFSDYDSSLSYSQGRAVSNKVTVKIRGAGTNNPSSNELEIPIEGKLLRTNLDPANYAVNSKHPVWGIASEAFGYERTIFLTHNVINPYHEMEPPNNRTLDLIMLGDDHKLQRIFSVKTFEKSELECGRYDDECIPEVNTTSRIIIISSKQTYGFNDLIVKSRTSTEKPGHPDKEQEYKPEISRSSVRYVWDGSSYSPATK